MKRLLALLIVLASSLSASYCEKNDRYVSQAGILNEKTVNVVSQYFDKKSDVKLEVYTNLGSGEAEILVFNPKGEKVDKIRITSNGIMQVTKSYSPFEGEWKVTILSKDGKGTFILKFHNKRSLLGMNKEDKKLIENKLEWESENSK